MPILVDDLAADNQVSIDPSTMENSTGRLLLQGTGNYVRIDAGVTLTQASITLGTNCSLVVGPDCQLAMIEIMGSRNGHISIGAGTQFTWSTRLYLHEPGRISIGKACLIASNTLLTVSDMHSILDIGSGQRINPAADVTLADKVWLAHETTVLKGSNIGSGCIIGYRSIVSGAIPANSLAVGSPARVIKSGITWDHGLL